MNFNEFRKHLQDIHGTLDDDPGTKQMSARLRREAYPADMEEYKSDQKKDKSTVGPTTAAGDSLRPHSKNAEGQVGMKNTMKTEGAADASAAGPTRKRKGSPLKVAPVVEDEVEEGAADASAAGPTRKRKGSPLKVAPVMEDETTPQGVIDYFDNYFDGELTEDTSDEDIIEAVNDLVELCDAVCEAVGLKKNLTVDEAFPRKISTAVVDDRPTDREVADKSGYLKPSPEQLKTALAKQADNSPLLQTGQGTNTKTVKPSDIQAKKRAKRIKRMAKFGK